VKKGVADDIADRLAKEPTRYGRLIDAAHLDDLRTIICNPQNWRQYFGAALIEAFPHGSVEARTFLGRLVPIRHKVSHANPISVHEAVRVVCYTLDVIEALKGYYMKRNLEQEYNAPTIIRAADSLGNVYDIPGMPRGAIQLPPKLANTLWPGDRLSIEVEVDPSFERSSYSIKWGWMGAEEEAPADSERVVIDIENKHVRTIFSVSCQVISNKDWHRFGNFDDMIYIYPTECSHLRVDRRDVWPRPSARWRATSYAAKRPSRGPTFPRPQKLNNPRICPGRYRAGASATATGSA
jgi:hypothetical protein